MTTSATIIPTMIHSVTRSVLTDYRQFTKRFAVRLERAGTIGTILDGLRAGSCGLRWAGAGKAGGYHSTNATFCSTLD